MTDAAQPVDSGAAPEHITVTTADDLQQSAIAQAEANQLPDDEQGQDAQPEPTGEESESSTDEETAKPAKGVQKRIDELVRQREEANRNAEKLQAMLEKQQEMLERALGGKQEQPKSAPQIDPADPPDPDSYDDGVYDPKFLRDLAKFEVRQEMEAARKNEALSAKRAEIAQREDAARAKYSDYNEVVHAQNFAPLLESSPGVFQALAEHDAGPDIAYYLGKNPEAVQSLAKMSPIHAAMELGRIAATLGPGEKEPQKASTESKAPAPIAPIKGSGAAPALSYEQRLEDAINAGNFDLWRKIKAQIK